MANPLKTFLEAILGKNSKNTNYEEIKQAEQAGTMAARNAAKRMGIVEQVEIDANKAREAATTKVEGKLDEKTEERV